MSCVTMRPPVGGLLFFLQRMKVPPLRYMSRFIRMDKGGIDYGNWK